MTKGETMSTLKRNSGFTLIELMITVAVIAILAGIAYPSYTEYVKKGRRADAKAAISKVQLAEEKWRTNNTSYTNSLANLGFVAELGVYYSPDKYYTLSIPSAGANAYVIKAQPTGVQSGDTACSVFTINQNGEHAGNDGLIDPVANGSLDADNDPGVTKASPRGNCW